jgi:hypothetical protein
LNKVEAQKGLKVGDTMGLVEDGPVSEKSV